MPTGFRRTDIRRRPTVLGVPGRTTSETEPFDGIDRLNVAVVALAWGSSFFWIAIALRAFDPQVIAFARVALGATALGLSATARTPVPRAAWPRIAVVGVVGNALPALLFATAQEHVASSVAGMINAVTPLAVLALGAVMFARPPTRREVVGLTVGFVGAVTMATASIGGASADARGVALLFAAVLCYGVANNVVVELQRSHGAQPVIARALLVASLVLAPVGADGLASTAAGWETWSAVAILGVVGTGLARSLSASLAGRRGASRAAIVTYLAPVVAMTLGVSALGEDIGAGSVLGVTLVLGAAAIVSR